VRNSRKREMKFHIFSFKLLFPYLNEDELFSSISLLGKKYGKSAHY